MTSNDTGCARDNSSVQISYCFTDPEMTEVSDQVRMESQPSQSVPGSRGPILRHWPLSTNQSRVLTAAGGGQGWQLEQGAGLCLHLIQPEQPPPGPGVHTGRVQGQRLSTKPPTTGRGCLLCGGTMPPPGPSCYLRPDAALVIESSNISIPRNAGDLSKYRHLFVAASLLKHFLKRQPIEASEKCFNEFCLWKEL